MVKLKESFGYDERLPESIREIFMWLCQDVVMLHGKWNLYINLFGNRQNADLLSEMASGSFKMIEEALRMDMVMTISRLSDSSKFNQRDDLSNISFLTLCPNYGDINGLDSLIEEFVNASEPIRVYRNKRVGHNDLRTRIQPNKNPIPGIRRQDIGKIISLADKILNLIYQRYTNGELTFNPVMPGDAETLIYWLKSAKKTSKANNPRF